MSIFSPFLFPVSQLLHSATTKIQPLLAVDSLITAISATMATGQIVVHSVVVMVLIYIITLPSLFRPSRTHMLLLQVLYLLCRTVEPVIDFDFDDLPVEMTRLDFLTYLRTATFLLHVLVFLTSLLWTIWRFGRNKADSSMSNGPTITMQLEMMQRMNEAMMEQQRTALARETQLLRALQEQQQSSQMVASNPPSSATNMPNHTTSPPVVTGWPEQQGQTPSSSSSPRTTPYSYQRKRKQHESNSTPNQRMRIEDESHSTRNPTTAHESPLSAGTRLVSPAPVAHPTAPSSFSSSQTTALPSSAWSGDTHTPTRSVTAAGGDGVAIVENTNTKKRCRTDNMINDESGNDTTITGTAAQDAEPLRKRNRQ